MEAIQTRNMKKRAISWVFFLFSANKLIAIEYPPTIFIRKSIKYIFKISIVMLVCGSVYM